VCLNLVMECMEGGELFERVVDRRKFAEHDAAHAIYQMLLSVRYIHKNGIVHRDLKLENFLYEKKASDHLKLIDFGFSHIWEPNTTMALSCGTLSYMAPEVLDKKYTSQCDMWSLGVISFVLLTGYMPFKGTEAQQMNAIRAGKYNEDKPSWRNLAVEAKSFVWKLLVVNATERLTAEQALQHRWILKNQDSATLNRQSSSVDDSTIEALCAFSTASQFRRACMSLMAWSLTNEERKQVRDAFLELDIERTGTISLTELKTVLSDRFHVSNKDVQRIFEAMDTSHDDEIHYTEFLAAMVSTRIAMHDDLLSKTFKRFDVDNNGVITRDNLKTVLGESFSGAEVEELLAEVDTENDGRISYDEFIRYLKGNSANSSHKLAATKIIDDEIRKISKQESSHPHAPRGLSVRSAILPEMSKTNRKTGLRSRTCVLL